LRGVGGDHKTKGVSGEAFWCKGNPLYEELFTAHEVVEEGGVVTGMVEGAGSK